MHVDETQGALTKHGYLMSWGREREHSVDCIKTNLNSEGHNTGAALRGINIIVIEKIWKMQRSEVF